MMVDPKKTAWAHDEMKKEEEEGDLDWSIWQEIKKKVL